MSKAHKMAKRMQRLEDTHRRDMVALKKELLDAVRHMLDERLPVEAP